MCAALPASSGHTSKNRQKETRWRGIISKLATVLFSGFSCFLKSKSQKSQKAVEAFLIQTPLLLKDEKSRKDAVS
jgi:hypothetical protein